MRNKKMLTIALVMLTINSVAAIEDEAFTLQ